MSIAPEPVYAEKPQDLPRRSSDPLCSNCRDLEDEITSHLKSLERELVDTEEWERMFDVEYDFGMMEKGAATGCPCCRLIRFDVHDVLSREAKYRGWERVPADEHMRGFRNNSASANESLTLLMASRGHGGSEAILLRLEVSLRETSHLKYVLWRDGTSSSAVEPFAPTFVPDIQLVSSLVRDWMSRCNDSHTACASQSASGLDSHPKRLLRTLPGAVRLIDTGGEHYQYAALSYCWGSRLQGTCTKGNVDRLQRAIKPEDVSATVMDAIRIADAIGLQYIWIDALCIVQDDPGDWTTESRKMQSIFESATLTIAASAVTDSSCSLFAPRQRSKYPLKPVRIGGSTLHLEKPSTRHLWDRRWRSRAWTMQEEAVSRRILYWDMDTLIWQCAEAEYYEWGHDQDHGSEEATHTITTEVPRWSSSDLGITRTLRSEMQRGPIQLRQARVSPYEAWDTARWDYFHRSITLPQDWPMAIQGLAEIAQKMQPDDSLVWGMWKSEFVPELAGWIVTDRLRRFPVGHKGIPSWSWLSQLGNRQIYYIAPYHRSQARVRGALDMASPNKREMASCVAVTPQHEGLFPVNAIAHLRGWLIKDWARYSEWEPIFHEPPTEEEHLAHKRYASLQRFASFLPLYVGLDVEHWWRECRAGEWKMDSRSSRSITRGILIAKKEGEFEDESAMWELVKPDVELKIPREVLEELEREEQQGIMLV